MKAFHELTIIDASLLILYTEYLTKFASELKGKTKKEILQDFIRWYSSVNSNQISINIEEFFSINMRETLSPKP
jgi:hypothetical protein